MYWSRRSSEASGLSGSTSPRASPPGGWSTSTFEIHGLGSDIVRDDLRLIGVSTGFPPPLWSAGVFESAVPGGSLSTLSDFSCRMSDSCRFFNSISFAPTPLQHIHILGGARDGGG